MWIDERQVFFVECENCTTYTITSERVAAFREAWRTDDRETLMFLESMSRYLRLGGDDCDREVTDANWRSFAADGDDMAGDDPDDAD